MARPWYPFYPSDYRRDTHLLSEKEDLYYRRLLDLQWELQGPLPKDLKVLGKLINCSSVCSFNRLFNSTLKKFFIEVENGYINERMAKEIEKCRAKSRTLAEAGRKGGLAKAKANAQAKALARPQPYNPPLPPQRGGVDFSTFWEAYPRKVGKKRAEVAWGRIKAGDRERIMEDLKTRFQGTDPKYIPHPTTYLHGERWNDERPDVVQGATSDEGDRFENWGERLAKSKGWV